MNDAGTRKEECPRCPFDYNKCESPDGRPVIDKNNPSSLGFTNIMTQMKKPQN